AMKMPYAAGMQNIQLQKSEPGFSVPPGRHVQRKHTGHFKFRSRPKSTYASMFTGANQLRIGTVPVHGCSWPEGQVFALSGPAQNRVAQPPSAVRLPASPVLPSCPLWLIFRFALCGKCIGRQLTRMREPIFICVYQRESAANIFAFRTRTVWHSRPRLCASLLPLFFLRALCGLFFLSRRELTRMRAPISICVYQRESVASVHGEGEQKLHRAASVTQGDEIHGG